MGNSDSHRYMLGVLSLLTFVAVLLTSIKAELPRRYSSGRVETILLVGAVFAVVGALFKFSSGLLGSDVISLFNKIEYEGLQLGLVGEGLAYIMMVFGAVMIFLAILAACGVCKQSKCCLMTFAGFLIFIIVIELLIVGLWVFYRQRTDQWLRGQMLNSLKSYNGPQATDTYSKGWNELFMKARCCGVNDQFKNGATNSDFTELPTTWTSGTDKVPATCCQGVTSSTIASYMNSASCTNTPSNFYTQGCYDRVSDTIGVFSLIIFITSGIALIIQVASIFLACVVVKHSQTKVSDIASTPKSKPPPYVSGNSAKSTSNWNIVRKDINKSKFTDGRY